jgi:hypothetical protein
VQTRAKIEIDAAAVAKARAKSAAPSPSATNLARIATARAVIVPVIETAIVTAIEIGAASNP